MKNYYYYEDTKRNQIVLENLFGLDDIIDIYDHIKISQCDFSESFKQFSKKRKLNTLKDLLSFDIFLLSEEFDDFSISEKLDILDNKMEKYGIYNFSGLSGKQSISINIDCFRLICKIMSINKKIQNKKNFVLKIDDINDDINEKIKMLYSKIFNMNLNDIRFSLKDNNLITLIIPEDYVDTLNYLINDMISDNILKYVLYTYLTEKYSELDFSDFFTNLIFEIRKRYILYLLLGKNKYNTLGFELYNSDSSIYDNKIDFFIEEYRVNDITELLKSIQLCSIFNKCKNDSELSIFNSLSRRKIRNLYELINFDFNKLAKKQMVYMLSVFATLANIGIYYIDKNKFSIFKNIDDMQFSLLEKLLERNCISEGYLIYSKMSEKDKKEKERQELLDSIDKASSRLARDKITKMLYNSSKYDSKIYDSIMIDDELPYVKNILLEKFADDKKFNNIKSLKELYDLGPADIIKNLTYRESVIFFNELEKYGIYVRYIFNDISYIDNNANVLIPYNMKYFIPKFEHKVYQYQLALLNRGILTIDEFIALYAPYGARKMTKKEKDAMIEMGKDVSIEYRISIDINSDTGKMMYDKLYSLYKEKLYNTLIANNQSIL